MKRKMLTMIMMPVMTISLLGGCAGISEKARDAGDVISLQDEEAVADADTDNEEVSDIPVEDDQSDTADNEDAGAADDEHNEEGPLYGIAVNWTYYELSDYTIEDISENYLYQNDVYVDVADGSSSIDLTTMRTETIDATDTYYAYVDGQEEKIYSHSVGEEGYYVELYRDDLKYSVSWQTFSNNIDTDCRAVIKDTDGNEMTRKRDDYLYRSYTGAWYFGICTITNGDFADFEPYTL